MALIKSINLTLVLFVVFTTIMGDSDIKSTEPIGFVESIPENDRGLFLAYSLGLERLKKHLKRHNRNDIDKYDRVWHEAAKELLHRDDVPENFTSSAVEFVLTNYVLDSDEYRDLLSTSEKYAQGIQQHIAPDDNISETCCPI